METIAVIGAGLVGRAWAIVFARAGHPVRLFDANAQALPPALDGIEASLAEMQAHGLGGEPPSVVRRRVVAATSLGEALREVSYAQENVFEDVRVKKDLFAAMDAAAPTDAILASSTSGIPASAFTADLEPGRRRCLVAHPINPPSLVPLVEVVPAPWTAPEVVDRTVALLERAGQVPIVVRRELPGFVVNRLQGALLMEAFRLVEDGYASSADVDKAVKDGLGEGAGWRRPCTRPSRRAARPCGPAFAIPRSPPRFHSRSRNAWFRRLDQGRRESLVKVSAGHRRSAPTYERGVVVAARSDPFHLQQVDRRGFELRCS